MRASFETDDLFFPLFHHPLADMPANLEEFPFAQPRSLTLPPAKEGDGIMKIEPKPSDWEVLAGLVERVTASWLPSLATRQSLRPVEWITASGEWVNERTHGQQFEAWFLRRATMAARRGGGGPAFPGADGRANRKYGSSYTIALAALAQPVLAGAGRRGFASVTGRDFVVK